jgi:hypothetical protein
MRLTTAGRVLRAGHLLIAVVELCCLGYLWLCALANQRGRALWVAIAALFAEGVALVVGRGDCPLGPLQQRLGDPVPLFELVLPRRAAKAAVPTFATITGVALAVLVARHLGSRRDMDTS